MPIRRASVSLKPASAISATRVGLNDERVVYVLIANRRLRYPLGWSGIVYMGTTQNGLSRVAGSVATRAPEVLRLHGVRSFEARILTCRPRQRIRMWRRLEGALLFVFPCQIRRAA